MNRRTVDTGLSSAPTHLIKREPGNEASPPSAMQVLRAIITLMKFIIMWHFLRLVQEFLGHCVVRVSDASLTRPFSCERSEALGKGAGQRD